MKSPEQRGKLYRKTADAITIGRSYVAGAFALQIASNDSISTLPNYGSWGMGISVGIMGALDKVDGWFARRGQLNGVDITDKDKKRDPYHDKLFTHFLLSSIVVRQASEAIDKYHINESTFWQNASFAGVVAFNQVTTLIRDRKINKSRENAVVNADVSALQINKYKTGIQNLGHAMATSPIIGNLPGMIATAMTYTASTVMGIVGYRRADKIHKGEV